MAQQQAATATARKPSALEDFRHRLQVRRPELIDALKGSGIDPDRFIRTAVTAGQTTPDLVTDVSFSSLWNELLKCCRDQLLPDGRQGVIVHFKGTAKWIPMYRGLLDRFEASGQYKWVTAGLHRDDDLAWDQWVDEHGQHFLHRPGPGVGKVIETYAAATTKAGGFFLSVVTEPDMQHIRSVARAKKEESPWNQWPDQMRLKTALRRLCKLLPMPQPLEDLVRYDDDGEGEGPAPLRLAAPAAPRRERPRGAQQALEQFSDDEPAARDERRPEPPATQPPQGGEPTDVEKAITDAAYRDGREAKAKGAKRTAVPGEFRQQGREAEVEAWRAGWDDAAPSEEGAADVR